MLRISERVLFAVTLIFFATATFGAAQESGAPAQSVQVFDSAKDIKWRPAPSMLPKGAQLAVLAGDPMKEGSPFTLRLKMPGGYKIPAHSHPTDENVTVLSGTLGAGMGDKLDPTKGQLIRAGGFVRMPQGMNHFAWAKGPTTVQIHGVGPLAFTYVNPADDPRNQH